MARHSELRQERYPAETEQEKPALAPPRNDGARARTEVAPAAPPETQPPETQPQVRDRGLTRKEKAGNFLREHPRARLIIFLVLLALVAGGIYFWIQYLTWESTDDAQVEGHIMPFSARIAGHVLKVNVEEGQSVKAGEILVEIDPADYQVAVARARAELEDAQAQARAAVTNVPVTSVSATSQVSSAAADVENARAGVDAAQKNVDAAQAKVNENQATAAKNKADLERYRLLIAKEEVSRQQYDQAVAAAQVGQAGVESARATLAAAEQQVVQARSRLHAAEAALRNANTAPQQVSIMQARAAAANATIAKNEAALKQAQLNLDYTLIKSPVDGIVGRKSVEVGSNVQPGQELLSVVPLNDVWVVANFKETQLRKMRPGQEARVSVDAYGRQYKGHVENIGAATGARYSLLPPENATGNYVKVVQRVPVRIELNGGENKDELLRPGMSVVPKVRVRP